LLLDGNQAASVPCESDGTFTVPITLTLGTHALGTKIYNVTDDTGPDGPTITVYYVAKTIGTTDRGGATPEQTLGAPLVLTIDEPFIVFGPAKDAVWLGTIDGGTLPYRVQINWGDGSNNDYTLTKGGAQHFSHHYRAMIPHMITLVVNDAGGRAARQMYAAVTPFVPPVGLFTNSSPSPWTGSNIFGIYGAYLVLVATFGFLWLRRHPFAYAKVAVRSTRNTPGRRSHKSTR
jgi:hypothetical protein